jgi:phosphomannomutase
VVEEIKARLLDENCEFNAVDGVRVQTSDGWWLLRASNTQGVLVARCESYTASGLSRLLELLIRHLRQSNVPAAPLQDELTRALAPSGGTWPALDMHAI